MAQSQYPQQSFSQMQEKSPVYQNQPPAPAYQQHSQIHQHQQQSPVYQPHQTEATAYEHASKLPAKWTFGLFDCFSPFSTCCLTCWCPCVTYGRIYDRERGEKNPSGLNVMCAAHCALLYCGFAPILQCINRGNMKDKYGMKANPVTDCLTSCCCGCCELIQEDKESILRTTGLNPKTNEQYVPPAAMSYS